VPDHEIPGERDWLVVEAGGRLVVFFAESCHDVSRMLEVAHAVVRLGRVAA
jgi:hypothetical protein